MPPKRKQPSSRGEEQGESSKKVKVGGNIQKDEEGNEYFELNDKRRVHLSSFKGSNLVGIREFYEKDGKMFPGKKGISLTIDQLNAFVTLLPKLEKVLKEKGETVARPQYDGPADAAQEPTNGHSKPVEKANHEETSDDE
ncbi:PC4-domain-containing protein [Piedraia hortae CBS 480.64]|uniref:PC4-domain-containing protein n=1 Tax=Piedraia hortae CBS 480.64 TaxID=1314780 RepID=A0A6A7BX20_9PEZI|nr:PC4-domain-containing protein [Piedraia hortae CBS 480.64]